MYKDTSMLNRILVEFQKIDTVLLDQLMYLQNVSIEEDDQNLFANMNII